MTPCVEFYTAPAANATSGQPSGRPVIKASELSDRVILWQLMLHLTFVASAVAIALIDRIMSPGARGASVHTA